MTPRRVAILLVLAAAIALAVYLVSGAHQVLTLDALKARQADFAAFRDAHPLLAVGGFLLAYLAVGILPVPIAALMAVLAGALFGLVGGFLVVSFGGALGACGGFLVARYALRTTLRRRYAEPARRIDEGVARDGALYLLSVRLVPVLPFFLVNLLFGLSAMPLRSFYAISQLGMAPGALLFANAGRELGALRSLDELMSASVLASFAALAALPWIARLLLRGLRARSAAT